MNYFRFLGSISFLVVEAWSMVLKRHTQICSVNGVLSLLSLVAADLVVVCDVAPLL